MGDVTSTKSEATCPHCATTIWVDWSVVDILGDSEGAWDAASAKCAACKKGIVLLRHLRYSKGSGQFYLVEERLVRPKAPTRGPVSPEVPGPLATDYREACDVLADSPKASAALGRRCLQHLLREAAKTKRKDLADQIQEVLDAKALPSHLAEDIDAVRNIGNFAAHPIKSTNTGEIMDVEPGEAEWTLHTLEGLFDFYFVAPAAQQRKRDALNAKLREAGKPPMKQ
jgi:hypothetical protein